MRYKQTLGAAQERFMDTGAIFIDFGRLKNSSLSPAKMRKLPQLIKIIIDFYSPALFYYCLMTSAGGNFTPHGNKKKNYHLLILEIFADFSLKNYGSLKIYYLVFQNTIRLCTIQQRGPRICPGGGEGGPYT